MQKIVARFSVRYTQYLNRDGRPIDTLPDFARNTDKLIQLYRAMVRTRAFDQRAIAMQRTGRLGTYASCLGQEAIGVAIGSAMQPDDVLLPYYRDQGAQFQRGVRMTEILLYWGGDERGMDYRLPRRDFPINVPVASQCSQAVGVAYAMQYRDEARVAVCTIGDGGTSKGDFYESLNGAGVWRLPVVFVVNNNQWAISVPRSAQTMTETLAQKAIAAGISAEQVDGNDAVAVYAVMETALERARTGLGPTLIEALSYRLGDHTTADDARRYRPEESVRAQWHYDPITRLRRYLTTVGVWTDTDEAQLETATEKEIDAAVAEYFATPAQPAESMFDYLYERCPDALVSQRDAVRPEVEDVRHATAHYG